MDTNTKLALVTCIYRGLRLATVRQLATQGYQVILTSRKPTAAEKIVAVLRQKRLEGKLDFIQ